MSGEKSRGSVSAESRRPAASGIAPSTSTHHQQQRRQFKVVLLGEGSVGKTSLVLRFAHGRFNDGASAPATTLQASFVTRRLTLADGRRLELAVWDTAGQERFHALGPIYYRDADGALLVYDIVDAHSYSQVQQWACELRRILGERVSLLIVANKLDLVDPGHDTKTTGRKRTVSLASALQYAESVDAKHCQVSAKTGAGVEQAFSQLCRQMLRNVETESETLDYSLAAAASGTKQLLVSDEEVGAPKSSCCR